jgi:hypothetical protein
MNNLIEINIEELVLHGFTPSDRHRIAEALQSSLSGMFTGKGINASQTRDINIPFADGGSFTMEPNARPARTGHSIAQAVFSSIPPK